MTSSVTSSNETIMSNKQVGTPNISTQFGRGVFKIFAMKHGRSPVGRADCMCLHGHPCIWHPFAAVCCYTVFYLLMMPAARPVCLCQRPSSNFPYFRTQLANFLLSRPNSVEYGNSKTTTLLLSAKCTRPLFQSPTGCGGRPSGWHDIVTCQRLLVVLYSEFRLKSSIH